MKRLWPGLLILLCLCGCFGRGSIPPEATPVQVQDVLLLSGRAHLGGQVTAEDTITFRNTTPALAAVSGARVVIEESGDAVSCDANGYFRFLNILPGDYHLRCYRRINDGSQAVARQHVTVSPGIHELPASMQLRFPGGLQGWVTLAGIPASSLRVEIDSPGGGRPLDPDGSWRFDGLAPGTYSVMLHREGYVSRSLGTHSVPSGGVLQVAESTPPLTPSGSPGFSLLVRTQDSAGRMLPDIQVWLAGNGQSGWTDSQGSLRFTGLAGRPLTLHASGFGYREATAAVHLDSDQTLPVILQAGGFQSQAVVQVIVKDGAGQPLAGARIRALPETLPAITDLAGNAIVPVDLGSSEIQISKGGYQTAVTQVHLQELHAAVTVTLQPAAATPLYRLSGIVQDQALQGQAGLTVYELQSGLAATTASDGSFTMTLPAGIRVLQVYGPLPTSARLVVDLQGDRSNAVLTLN